MDIESNGRLMMRSSRKQRESLMRALSLCPTFPHFGFYRNAAAKTLC